MLSLALRLTKPPLLHLYPRSAAPLRHLSSALPKPVNMPKATWNGAVIAESDKFETVEGNVYFPMSSVKSEYLKKTDTTSVCPWKGTASYYSLVVDGKENKDAVWTYVQPKDAAANIKDHVAFWKGVEVSK
eukprot:TRINITY_DN17401_c0_g1_i1.p1 TRINITY_DN17401_c0_g1~~TRINITY_DN17401_c0_g1_i1.p1  ORF type:complete len:131 (-),score=27.66 TRINITY_DN17401_c0_g1_i1:390-782(-)